MATSIYKILKKLATKINKVEEIASEIDPITDEEIDRAFNSSMSGKWIGLLNSEEYIELAKMMAEEYDQITYLKGEWCWHNNNLYEATVDINTPEAFNIDHWFLLYEDEIHITTLANTRWVMKEILDNSTITSGTTFNITGDAGGTSFIQVEFLQTTQGSTNYDEIWLDDYDAPWYQNINNASTSGWGGADGLRDVTITGGTNVTNSTLIAWFIENATLVPEEQPVISLVGTTWVMNDTIVGTPGKDLRAKGTFGSNAFNYIVILWSDGTNYEIWLDEEYDVYNNGWDATTSKTVTITDLGSVSSNPSLKEQSKLDVRDADIINWFVNNGTLQSNT